MNPILGIALAAATLPVDPPVAAPCTVTADATAAVRPVDVGVKADVDLLLAMTMAPKILKTDYAAASARPGCDLGELVPGRADYRLWGDDGPGRARKALSRKKGAPVALILPVVDLVEALEASRSGRSAPLKGYMLATVTRADVTGYRLYTAMPDAAVLRRDMAAALAGGVRPLFRNEGTTTRIVMPAR